MESVFCMHLQLRSFAQSADHPNLQLQASPDGVVVHEVFPGEILLGAQNFEWSTVGSPERFLRINFIVLRERFYVAKTIGGKIPALGG